MPKRSKDYVQGLVEDLKDPIEAMNYLNAALEESQEVFLLALRDVAAANRMARVAEEAGLSREALYRTLSEEGNPRLSSLLGILSVMNLKISIAVEQEQPAIVGVAISNYRQVFADEAARQESVLLAKLADQYSRRTQKEQPEPSGILAYAGH